MNKSWKRFTGLFVLSAFLLSGRFAFGAVLLDGGSETYDARVDVVNELLSVDRAFDTYSGKHPEWLRNPRPVVREVTPSGIVNIMREGVDYRIVYSAGIVKFKYDLHPKSLIYADYSYTEDVLRGRDDSFIDVYEDPADVKHESEVHGVVDVEERGGGGEGPGDDEDHDNGHGNDGDHDDDSNPGNGGGEHENDEDSDGEDGGDQDGGDHEDTGDHGNNGVGNGEDPQPPGNPPVNDGAGSGPGNPGNQGGVDSSNAGGHGKGK